MVVARHRGRRHDLCSAYLAHVSTTCSQQCTLVSRAVWLVGCTLTVNRCVAGSHISALWTELPSVNWIGFDCGATEMSSVCGVNAGNIQIRR